MHNCYHQLPWIDAQYMLVQNGLISVLNLYICAYSRPPFHAVTTCLSFYSLEILVLANHVCSLGLL